MSLIKRRLERTFAAQRAAEVQRELERLHIRNDPEPEVCPSCHSELERSSGYVGEAVLFCPNQACDQGVVWEDNEDAIRRVL